MSRRSSILRAQREASAAAELTLPAYGDDAEQFAAELAHTARAAKPPIQEHVDMIMRSRPEDFTFDDLERLAATDPALSAAKWDEVKAAARRDLASGYMTGRSVERMAGNAWRRAMYLAVRTALIQAWPPRHAGDALLLDQLAQYEMMRQHWLAIVADWSYQPSAVVRRSRDREPDRRVHSLEALREAARMLEMWQRLFRTTLSAFLRQRRPTGSLFVARANQLNVTAGPQVNVQQETTEKPQLTNPAPAPLPS